MTKKNQVVNTARQMKANPLLAAVMVLGGLDQAIEEQERTGTKQAAASSVLPTDGLHDYAEGGKYAYLGIKVLDVVKDDDMFTHVELPEGWSIRVTDHAMHNDIVDDKGRKRSSYFYKAAFYDRNAQMYGPTSRFDVCFGPMHQYDGDAPFKERVVRDNALNVNPADHECGFDPDAVLVSFGRNLNPGERGFEVNDELKAKAIAWLDERYPQHRDPAAYWD